MLDEDETGTLLEDKLIELLDTTDELLEEVSFVMTMNPPRLTQIR